MNITFTPQRRDDALTLEVDGDTLTINGEAFDFSGVPNGATLPREAIACVLISGPVERDGSGVLTVPVLLPIGPGAPEAARFPAPMTDVPDGLVDMTVFAPEEEADE
ncbi:MAG: hypothetical protein ACU0CF_04620 [Sagittula sp.]|uniref:hypothetical protein n=1 Tax=Sagittula sp. TaxID=2038081 RepID=UPI0040594442